MNLNHFFIIYLTLALSHTKAADFGVLNPQGNQSIILQLPANLDFMIGISHRLNLPEGIYSNQKILLFTTKKKNFDSGKVVDNVIDPEIMDPFIVIILQNDQAIQHIIQTQGWGKDARNHKINITNPLTHGSYRLDFKSRVLSKQIAPLQVQALASIGKQSSNIRLNAYVLTFDSQLFYAKDGM